MIPIVLFFYKRLNTTKRVWETIQRRKPSKLYLIADGPKNITEKSECNDVKNYIENNISWYCDIIKIYSKKNLGCAKRIQSGLDQVFENEEMAIILEDDTLPDQSFKFCEELLLKYRYHNSIVHISGCNLYPGKVNLQQSYFFSSIINIWGWATWRRAWNKYNIEMPTWDEIDKKSFLNQWIPSKTHRQNFRKMFDLHCKNKDPWTWDYQWVYNCWKNNGLSINPSFNLVSNIGVGPNASNTKHKTQIELYHLLLALYHFHLNIH